MDRATQTRQITRRVNLAGIGTAVALTAAVLGVAGALRPLVGFENWPTPSPHGIAVQVLQRGEPSADRGASPVDASGELAAVGLVPAPAALGDPGGRDPERGSERRGGDPGPTAPTPSTQPSIPALPVEAAPPAGGDQDSDPDPGGSGDGDGGGVSSANGIKGNGIGNGIAAAAVDVPAPEDDGGIATEEVPAVDLGAVDVPEPEVVEEPNAAPPGDSGSQTVDEAGEPGEPEQPEQPE